MDEFKRLLIADVVEPDVPTFLSLLWYCEAQNAIRQIISRKVF